MYTASTLDMYKRAIFQEIVELKNNGGRKYKVTGGVYLSSLHGGYAYSFTMETELHLSDDAPVTLTVVKSQATATGNVLKCEGFQIIVVIDRDFGARIDSALIGVAPWKLLEALYNKLDNITPANSIAFELLNQGPELAEKNHLSNIVKGQKAARKHALSSKITVIWGPPGTGKTYTMAQIAIDALLEGKSVLVVSHSNISVDGVTLEIAKQLREGEHDEYLREGKVLRYGYVRDTRLVDDKDAVAFNYALESLPSVRERRKILLQEKSQLQKNREASFRRRLVLEEELKNIRIQIRQAEKEYVWKAKIVATTISKVTIDPLFEDKRYDFVMFDEVSMAYVPQILCAASLAKEHFIAVGDFRQLAPIAQSEAKDILNKDLFSYLGINNGIGSIYNHPWLVMLNEQRRMYPDISAFPNIYVYGRLLKDHAGVAEKRLGIVNEDPFAGHSMIFVDLSGTYCAASKNDDNSRFNILSAVISLMTAMQAERKGEHSVGIITPYAAQTRLIRAMLQDYQQQDDGNITCATVHQFQGSERNIIVFDAVESYPAAKPGWLMSKNENGNLTRLINVAVTRARGKFITVADKRFWTNKIEDKNNIIYLLIKHLLEHGNVVSHKDRLLENYLKSLDIGENIKLYMDAETAFDYLRQDIKQAENKIVISIPDGELNEKIRDKLFTVLAMAKKNGIRLLCKSNDYNSLPDEWKKITVETDDAVFPLLAIDDKVIWYGMPASKGAFHDKNLTYTTVCHTYLRITGSNTIDMIKTLTEPEHYHNGSKEGQLTEKAATIRQHAKGGEATEGLENYINDVVHCQKCGKPMLLVKNRKGIYYLKCSGCKGTALLTEEIVNFYIFQKHVTCPTHHCQIYARLGRYGIYVRCTQGGHYLKPDEI
ncbi:MAG: AAA domain-containing protein [Firmicutes bacterium]|nr:AAA domain-containing protein [Bacillota bacterium]